MAGAFHGVGEADVINVGVSGPRRPNVPLKVRGESFDVVAKQSKKQL